jgi:hypothetical protein
VVFLATKRTDHENHPARRACSGIKRVFDLWFGQAVLKFAAAFPTTPPLQRLIPHLVRRGYFHPLGKLNA